MGEPDAASLDGSVASYRKAFFDRDPARSRMHSSRAATSPRATPGGRFVTEHFARQGAQTGVDRALRLDTTVMLVDDPVKRVDNMTMAWGLEGRVPFLDHELVELAATCPPDLKTAHDGKGVLKEAARRVIPADVIDRPKGYFPVPALTHLEGPYLDMVRDALYAPVAKERGLFRPEAVDATARRPQRSADPAARQRAVADRAARTVAAKARHLRVCRMSTPKASASEDRSEARTGASGSRGMSTPSTTIPRPSHSGCTTRHHRTWSTLWRTMSSSNSVGAD